MSEKFLKGLLRIHQVLALVPIGESSWWKGCKEGIYPDILTSKGLIPSEIIADGKLHRCPTEAKPHKQNGA